MDFSIHTNTRFKVGIDFYLRLYQATVLRDGSVQIRHVRTGSVLAVLDPSTILVDGHPMQSIDDLQAVIYNLECDCDTALDDNNKRIFDMSFDKTFE